ncbi:ribosome recycling factor [Bacteriovorax sp. PP10]|uniref:Ribosome-recycling factor n=1 Tax=Bacteriovorax antarcticus TaxID=3088717 RepID=A0ABU5VU10_9BACT|nr:ribosome recycling factor [Bacteriovorax sp. PP10]MEA9356538.1 ribosome recycling factor [Bacteriovorax sp. PP10]
MMKETQASLNDSMKKAVDSLKHQLTKVRTGRASASVLDGVQVEYYGSLTPLSQLGQISTPEARLLQIQPFDKTMLGAIEKALFGANLGVTPTNDGNFIRLNFPSLTEDKRKDIAKEIKKIGEDAKVVLRNLRRDSNEAVKKAEKDKTVSEDDSKKIQTEIQNITDKFTKEIDTVIANKEKEVLSV